MLNSISKFLFQELKSVITCAVSRKDVLYGRMPDFFAKRVQFSVCHLIKMQTAHISADIAPSQHIVNVRQDICHPDMGAAVENHEPVLRFNDQALFMGKTIRMAFSAMNSIQIVVERYGRIVRPAMRNQPDTVLNLMNASYILNT